MKVPQGHNSSWKMEVTEWKSQNLEINSKLLEINRKDTKILMESQEDINLPADPIPDELEIIEQTKDENFEQWTWNYNPTNGHCYSFPNIQEATNTVILDPISSISIDVDLPDKSLISDILEDVQAHRPEIDNVHLIQMPDICTRIYSKRRPQVYKGIEYPDPIQMPDSSHSITCMKYQQKIDYPAFPSAPQLDYHEFPFLPSFKAKPKYIPRPVRHMSESSSISTPSFCFRFVQFFKRQQSS